MKLTVIKDRNLNDDYVEVKYRELTPTLHQIIQLCEDTRSVLLCEIENSTYNVDINDILYIEWIDGRSCVYTEDEVYTIPAPLKQLEESLNSKFFVRISKMALVNIYKIKSVSNGLNFRLTVEMMNGENIVANRNYRSGLLTSIRNLAKEVQ